MTGSGHGSSTTQRALPASGRSEKTSTMRYRSSITPAASQSGRPGLFEFGHVARPLAPGRDLAAPEGDHVRRPVVDGVAAALEVVVEQEDAVVIVGDQLDDLLAERPLRVPHEPLDELAGKAVAVPIAAHHVGSPHGEGDVVGARGEKPFDATL